MRRLFSEQGRLILYILIAISVFSFFSYLTKINPEVNKREETLIYERKFEPLSYTVLE